MSNFARVHPYESHLIAAADGLIDAGEANESLRASLWAAYRRQRAERQSLLARIAGMQQAAARRPLWHYVAAGVVAGFPLGWVLRSVL